MLIRKTCNILILKFQKLLRKREGEEKREFLTMIEFFFIFSKVEHGEIGVVDAWGSRPAYRVPKEDFESILKRDESSKPFIKTIDA